MSVVGFAAAEAQTDVSSEEPTTSIQETEEREPTGETEALPDLPAAADDGQMSPASEGGLSPRWEAGLGIGFPDYYFLESRYSLAEDWVIRAYYTPPIPFYLTVNAPADEEVIKSRLKAGTPPASYEAVVRYKSNFGLESQHYPFEGSGFYFSYGAGYRKIHVTARGTPDLFVCLVTPDIPCDKAHETWASGAKIDMRADIEISAYLLRSSLGWRWNWDNGIYVDWAFMGLAIPFLNQKSITVESELITKETIPEADEIIKEMEDYLEKKKASIMGRVVSNVDKFDQMKLPIGSLSIGYRF